jgi:PAS domain S-box-containing protein
MKSVFTIDDNGHGMEEVRSFLHERGYSVTETGAEFPDEVRFTRFAIDRACVQVFWLTPDQRIIYVNDAACSALGYTREELTRMSVRDIDPCYFGLNEPERSEIWNRFREKGYGRFETNHRARDGRVYPVEVQCNFLEFEGREYSCCFVTDISERKQVEEKLLLQQFCIEKADTIFMQFSAEGKILMVNECACRSLGYTRDELLSLYDVDIVPTYSNEKGLFCQRTLDDCGSMSVETVFRRKDGSIFPIEFTCNKLDFHGKSYVVGLGSDISERRKAEEALQISQFIVDKASIGICRGHEDGRILYANEHIARMLGYTREELCSMTYFDIVPDMGEQRWREHRLLLRTAGSRKFEAIHRRKDGTTFPVDVSVNYMEFGENPFSCSFTQDITDRKKAGKALLESEKKFRLLTEISPNAVIVIHGERIVYANPAATDISGYPGEQLRGMEFWKFMHDDCRDVARQRLLARQRGEPASSRYEYRIISSRGEERWVLASSVHMDYEGAPAVLVTFVDITEVKCAEEERKNLEEQLHQARKMDAVGQLAGGIAHDFNNILTAIMGFAEVMMMRMEQGDRHEHHVRQILAAAKRAADLTHGLLAFSRKQVLHVRAIDVCDVVDGVKNMLRRLIPEDIDFRVKTDATGMIVVADRGQIEQVLMNLVTNARDFMPTGGILTIEAGPVVVDDDACHGLRFGVPGRYARIAVEDTGNGMDEETRQKIFEPFFTTKEVGKGTGLGLSIVYGIVKQHKGFITVDSLPGRGTTICVYLPLVDQDKQELSEVRRAGHTPGGNEKILLAEDDDVVRELTRGILEEAGYTVIVTSGGLEALEMFKERGTSVDMLVTDVIMPTMDGKRLHEEIVRIRPDLKVLFVSGYPADFLNARGVVNDGINFMPKPVMPSELLERLREILDRN